MQLAWCLAENFEGMGQGKETSGVGEQLEGGKEEGKGLEEAVPIKALSQPSLDLQLSLVSASSGKVSGHNTVNSTFQEHTWELHQSISCTPVGSHWPGILSHVHTWLSFLLCRTFWSNISSRKKKKGSHAQDITYRCHPYPTVCWKFNEMSALDYTMLAKKLVPRQSRVYLKCW